MKWQDDVEARVDGMTLKEMLDAFEDAVGEFNSPYGDGRDQWTAEYIKREILSRFNSTAPVAKDKGE